MRLFHGAKFVISVVLVSALSLVFFVAVYAPSRLQTEFDDSYMYCRYASNFLAGNGFSWNASDGAAYGATSPVFLLLVTLSRYLFHYGNSFLLSFLSFSAGLMGLAVLVMVGYKSGEKLSKWHFPLLVIPLCLVSSSFRYHSFTGMETTLSFFSNTLLIFSVIYYSRKPGNSAFVFLLLSAIFTFQVRPDNGVYSLLFPILYLLSNKRITLKNTVIYLTLFFVAAGLLLLLYSSFFGGFLPIPFFAKSGGYFVGYAGRANWNSAEYVLRFVRDAAPFIGIVILFARKNTTTALVSIFIPVAITFGYYATVVQIMGWFARYYFPSIPFIVFAAFIAVENQIEKKYSLSLKHISGRVAVLLVFFLPVFWSPLRSEITDLWEKTLPETRTYVPETAYITPALRPLEIIPWWDSIQYISAIVGSLPPGAEVAATEYGYIAAENIQVAVIDMAGLHDRELALSGFSSNRILSRNPDFIWMPHSDYTRFRKELLDDPEFYTNYEYYPGVFNYGVALRLNSGSYEQMMVTLDSVFQSAYPERELGDYLGSAVNDLSYSE